MNMLATKEELDALKIGDVVSIRRRGKSGTSVYYCSAEVIVTYPLAFKRFDKTNAIANQYGWDVISPSLTERTDRRLRQG